MSLPRRFTVNVPLMRATLAAIEADPTRHNQSTYFSSDEGGICATTYCFAGWVCVLDGYTLPDGYYLANARGESVRPAAHAIERLRLTDEQMYELFDEAETLPEVRDAVDRLCGTCDHCDQPLVADPITDDFGSKWCSEAHVYAYAERL